MNTFVTYVRDAVTIQLGLDAPTTYPKFAAAMRRTPDKYSPFRELAPSRVRCKGSDGPFIPELIWAKAGIFSATLWRGITYATELATEGPMIFLSRFDFMNKKTLVHEIPSTSHPTYDFLHAYKYYVSSCYDP
jgi:hypothetical protein